MYVNNASEITEAFVCVEIKSHTDTFTVHSKSVYISWNEEEKKVKESESLQQAGNLEAHVHLLSGCPLADSHFIIKHIVISSTTTLSYS